MKVLVLGATGVFGSRLARRLATYPDISIVLASRSKAKAEALCTELKAESGTQSITSVEIDLDQEEVAAQLADTRATIIVHTAGPFQGQDYKVARAAISCGMHYIDIADGRTFVANFHELDGAAKQASVVAVSGASSVPGLSSAVIGDLCSPKTRIDHVDIAISPGNRAPRGKAVVHAILSYCGEAIPDGTLVNESARTGWGRLRRLQFDGVGKRWISDCDVPDLDVLRRAFPDIGTISFGAGLELSVMHLGLSALSKLRQYKLLPNLALFSTSFHWIADKLMPFGSDVGGMKVSVTGAFMDGGNRTHTWSLVAGNGDGPYVPILPAVVMTRRLIHGKMPSGAYACLNQLSLDEFQDAAKGLDIVCRWRP